MLSLFVRAASVCIKYTEFKVQTVGGGGLCIIHCLFYLVFIYTIW